MIQMQAAMLDFAAPMAGASASSSSPSTTAPKQSFDFLLGKYCAILDGIARNARAMTSAKPNSGPANQLEEEATGDLSMLAALLTQPLGLAMLASQLQGQKSEFIAGETLDADGSAQPQPLQPLLLSADVESGTALSLQTTVAAEAMTGTQPVPVPLPETQNEATTEQPMLELMEQLEAEVSEVAAVQTTKGALLVGRGQLDRYWLLRDANLAEPASDSRQALTPAVLATEAFQDLRLELPQAATNSEQSQDLPTATELPVELLGQQVSSRVPDPDVNDQSNHVHQFAAQLESVTGGPSVANDAQLTDVSYVARPELPLNQQLEQGLAAGLRQLRLLHSQEGITVRMRLYPESLGEVRLELKVVGTTLTAQLRALEPQAANVLRSELPLLRENLANQGFTEVVLGAETAEYFGQSAGREQQPFQEQQTQGRQQIISATVEDTEKIEVEPTVGRLDYRL